MQSMENKTSTVKQPGHPPVYPAISPEELDLSGRIPQS